MLCCPQARELQDGLLAMGIEEVQNPILMSYIMSRIDTSREELIDEGGA